MGNFFPKKNDPRGGHTRMYWDIQDHVTWRALSFSAQCLYMAMRRKLGKTNNGNIEATVFTMREQGFTAAATLFKALRELQAVGLIAKTRQGGIARSTKECNLYRFTDLETYECPKKRVTDHLATNEWRHFKTLADAKGAIEAAHMSAKKAPSENKPCIQKLKLSQEVEQAAKHRTDLLSAEIHACH